MQPASVVRSQLELTANRILESVNDVSPEEFLARPHGLAPILWQIGHVALVDTLLRERAGEGVEVPAAYRELFARGAGGEGPFPPSREVLDFFRSAHAGLLRLAEGDLDRPAAASSGVYRTVGDGLIFLLYHRGYHHGKIMTLRGLLNKPRLLG